MNVLFLLCSDHFQNYLVEYDVYYFAPSLKDLGTGFGALFFHSSCENCGNLLNNLSEIIFIIHSTK